jgi:uncharacterized Zn finger protein (UPF0148 family)
MPTAIFGIGGGGLNLFVELVVLFLIITYLALIWWTYLDARRRIEDPVLIACAVAASLFPFVGTVVYTILRPPEFIEDRQERDLELRASELRLRQLIDQSCPHCEYPIERNYLRCPNCERRLRNPCRKCGEPLDPKWGVCPYCEAEVRKPRAERERPVGRRVEGARRERAAAKRSSADARDQRERAGARADGPRGDRTPRREPRPPLRAQGGASDRQTGGASGSFPRTDR